MSPSLSVGEAAFVTGVPRAQVQRIIELGLLYGAAGRAGFRTGQSQALVGLKLAHETSDRLTVDQRRRLVIYLLDHPEAETARDRHVSVDVRAMASEVQAGIDRLESVRKVARCQKAVLAGAPCFRGTRIPVQDVSEMLANGDTADAIQEAFPQLTKDLVELADTYFQAYPARRRRRWKPFRRTLEPTDTRETTLHELIVSR